MQEVKADGQTDIFARRVTANGVILDGTAITIGYHTAFETGPAVGAIPTTPNFGMYAVAWELHYSATDTDIYVRGVNGSGATNPVGVVVNTGDDETHPAIAGNEACDHFLVTWSAPYPDPFANAGIYARPLLLNGDVTDQKELISGLFADYSAVTAGAMGDFLVVHQDPNLFYPATYDIWGRLWGYRSLLPLLYK